MTFDESVDSFRAEIARQSAQSELIVDRAIGAGSPELESALGWQIFGRAIKEKAVIDLNEKSIELFADASEEIRHPIPGFGTFEWAALAINLGMGEVEASTIEQKSRIVKAAIAMVRSPKSADKPPDPPSHNDDFTSVKWFGTVYTFSARQGRIIACLWAAWEQGLTVATDRLKAALKNDEDPYPPESIRDCFKLQGGQTHPAWGNLIGWPAGRGKYQLVEPQSH